MYAFYKGVNLSDPFRSDDGEQFSDETGTTGNLAAESGDMLVAVSSFTGNVASWSWTNATEILNDNYRDTIGSYAEDNLTDITSVYIDISGVGDDDGSIARSSSPTTPLLPALRG